MSSANAANPAPPIGGCHRAGLGPGSAALNVPACWGFPMSKSKLLAGGCAAAAWLAASSSSAASLLVNGSFEGPPADTNAAEHYARGVAPQGWSALPGLD